MLLIKVKYCEYTHEHPRVAYVIFEDLVIGHNFIWKVC